MRRIRRYFTATEGVAAVEFALIGIPFIFLFLGLVEFGRAMHIRSAMDNAADRAQRMVIIDPAVSISDLTADVRRYFVSGNSSALTVSVTETTSSVSSYRLISLSYDMQLLLPVLVTRAVTLTMDRRVALSP